MKGYEEMGLIVCEEENYDFDRQDGEYIFIIRIRKGLTFLPQNTLKRFSFKTLHFFDPPPRLGRNKGA